MKTRLMRLALAAVALAVPAATGPAHADVAVAFGTGWIDPGVPAPPACLDGAHFEITGTAANLGTTFGPGPYDFTVIGDSTSACPSFLNDEGGAVISGDVTGSLTYTRTVGLITLSGFVRIDSSDPVPVAMTCQVAILDAQPVRNFAVVCAVTL